MHALRITGPRFLDPFLYVPSDEGTDRRVTEDDRTPSPRPRLVDRTRRATIAGLVNLGQPSIVDRRPLERDEDDDDDGVDGLAVNVQSQKAQAP